MVQIGSHFEGFITSTRPLSERQALTSTSLARVLSITITIAFAPGGLRSGFLSRTGNGCVFVGYRTHTHTHIRPQQWPGIQTKAERMLRMLLHFRLRVIEPSFGARRNAETESPEPETG